MNPLSRRSLLAIGAAGSVVAATHARAQNFGNPDAPPEGAINASPGTASDPGPQNPAIAGQFPSSQDPPATDVGELPQFWSSFNTAHRRIQAGGWAREVTRADFPIAEAISGVNMRLSTGGIRELHWHLAAEWGYMITGKCRVTVLDETGRPYVQDVSAGDIWYFPPGQPHSLQGLGPDGTEFLIAFDDGSASEYNTLLVGEWFAHTPPDVLAANFGVPADKFRSIPLTGQWIFQGAEPGPLATDQAAVRLGGVPRDPLTFSLASTAPIKQTSGGTLQMVDSRTFKVSKTVAAALETIKPGAVRELHWHPNADEWQYWIKGEGRMTVFNAGPRAHTRDFRPGDIGYVKRSTGHYVQNTGTTDLQFVALFKTAEYAEISLAHWLANTPPGMVAQSLHIDPAILTRFAQDAPGIMPL